VPVGGKVLATAKTLVTQDPVAGSATAVGPERTEQRKMRTMSREPHTHPGIVLVAAVPGCCAAGVHSAAAAQRARGAGRERASPASRATSRSSVPEELPRGHAAVGAGSQGACPNRPSPSSSADSPPSCRSSTAPRLLRRPPPSRRQLPGTPPPSSCRPSPTRSAVAYNIIGLEGTCHDRPRRSPASSTARSPRGGPGSSPRPNPEAST